MPSFRPVLTTWSIWDPDDTANAFVDQRILAEGDSWFTISGFPVFNLLQELRFGRATEIVNCALPADTIKNMRRIVSNRGYRVALSDASLRWDAILLSGGGNDVIDRAAWLLRPKEYRRPEDETDARGFVIAQRLDLLMQRIQDGYRDLIAQRDASPRSSGAPIILHTYDYATPRDAPALGLGPWLHPAFEDESVPDEFRMPVVKLLIDRLAETLLELAASQDNVHVVDTRGLLVPAELGATGDSNDWQNEIHPNGDGYAKIAAVMGERMRQLGVG